MASTPGSSLLQSMQLRLIARSQALVPQGSPHCNLEVSCSRRASRACLGHADRRTNISKLPQVTQGAPAETTKGLQQAGWDQWPTNFDQKYK